MNLLQCFTCGNEQHPLVYNIKTTYTCHSNKILYNFVETLVGEMVKSHWNICQRCFDLLNELDAIELRSEEIRKIFKMHYEKNCKNGKEVQIIKERDINQQVQDINIHDNYKCAVGLKKFTNKCKLDDHVQNKHLQQKQGDFKENNICQIENNLTRDFTINDLNEIQLFTCNETEKAELSNISTTELLNSLPDIKPDLNIFSEITIDNKIHLSTSESNNLCSTTAESKVPDGDDTVKKKKPGRKKKDPGVLKPHECHCSKTFRTLREYQNHLLSHSSEKPYICEICGKAYKHVTGFDIHVKMHKGINPYSCNHCNKSFTQKVSLLRHTRLHTGEMPFQCHLCGKRFAHHTSFKIHKLSHSGEKSYKCDTCGLTLISSSHLKRHMRIHTGEKKYSCSTCGVRFAEKYNLAAHEKLHGIESSNKPQKRMYRCQICTSSFERKVKLEDHLVQEHQKIIDC